MSNKYIGPKSLGYFLDKLKSIFADKEAIETLEVIISSKADEKHTHAIADMPNLQAKLDEKSNTGHNHYAQAITQGVLNIERLPTVTIAKGGTGATTVEGARTKLDVYSKAEITDLLSNTSALIVSVIDMDTNQLSHTFEEIIAAYENGQTVLLSLYNGTELLSPCFLSEDKTYIGFANTEMEVSEDQYAYAWMNGCRIYSDGSVKIDYADLLTRRDPGIEYENKDIISALNYAITEITNLENKIGDGFTDITSEDIQGLFA